MKFRKSLSFFLCVLIILSAALMPSYAAQSNGDLDIYKLGFVTVNAGNRYGSDYPNSIKTKRTGFRITSESGSYIHFPSV